MIGNHKPISYSDEELQKDVPNISDLKMMYAWMGINLDPVRVHIIMRMQSAMKTRGDKLNLKDMKDITYQVSSFHSRMQQRQNSTKIIT